MKLILAVLASVLATPSLAQLVRCDTPTGVVYQDTPCETRSQQRTLEDRLNIVDRHPQSPRSSPPAEAVSGPRVGMVGKSDREEDVRCGKLRRSLERVDAQARDKSTAKTSKRRRELIADLAEYRCGRLGR